VLRPKKGMVRERFERLILTVGPSSNGSAMPKHLDDADLRAPQDPAGRWPDVQGIALSPMDSAKCRDLRFSLTAMLT
jgi:hypothetical protein